jgi:exonuclease VII small subunit
VTRKPKETGFEAALAELEQLVARMETGDLPWKSLGIRARRTIDAQCQSALQAAQRGADPAASPRVQPWKT